MLPLTNSQKCANEFRDIWNEKINYKESTYIIYLNDKRHIMFYTEICTGRSTDCPFDVREAIQYALNIHSNYVVVAHNHTSNIAKPSELDILFTKGLQSILGELQIVLIDHIILTRNDYYSFADNGLLTEYERKIA